MLKGRNGTEVQTWISKKRRSKDILWGHKTQEFWRWNLTFLNTDQKIVILNGIPKNARIFLNLQTTIAIQQKVMVWSFGKQRQLVTITLFAKDMNALSNYWSNCLDCKGQFFTPILIWLLWQMNPEERLSLLHSTYTQALKFILVEIWRCRTEWWLLK